MRKYFLLFVFLISAVSYGQKIKKNEIDKFTKSAIIETSIETLYSVNFMGKGWCNKFEFCIRRTNETYSMPANILMNEIVKYTENDGVTLLLDNDETIILTTNYTGIGGDAFAQGYWFNTVFSLTNEDVEKLKTNKVVAIRVRYLGGSYDRELKKNKQELIMKSLRLFDSL